MGRVEAVLSEMGIELPKPVAPVADYAPWVRTGNLVFVSGQVPIGGDGVITGQLDASDHAANGVPAPGSKLGLAVGAATLCGVNVLAQLKSAIGDLDQVVRVVKLTGFVNADASFTQHPQVVNGASSLMIGAFGDKGKHARAAVGCSSLPLGAICEVEAVFEVA
jgi:enamine deaminase RidA (YjgF/YER057c/UK114 family)